MNENALITGAAGFLGSFLAEELLLRGYVVIGIDNFFRGRKENLPNHKNFTFYEMDLSAETEKVRKIIKEENIESVFHYAAINGTQYFYDTPYQVLDANIKITQNILESLKGSSVKKVIYASSSEVYGKPAQIPTTESYPISLNINTKRDCYAASKAIGEFYTRLFAEENNLDYLILRIFNTYGPRMDTSKYGQVVPEFIMKVLQENEFTIIGNGSQTRSFCYVSDHTKLVASLAEVVSNVVINVGNDEEVKIITLAKIIHDIVGREFNPKYLLPRDSDPPRRCPDIAKLRELTNMQPEVTLEDGLRSTINSYYNNYAVKHD